jgi:DNA invertase Pin-like site-specific DNA recombinase
MATGWQRNRAGVCAMSAPVRAALYARVSTGHQDHQLQRDALLRVAEQRGWETTEYVDTASGSGVKLPERGRMMADAQAGKIDLVACWRFDRFARSTRDLLDALDSFRKWNVEFISLQEGIDTSTPTGRMMFTIIGALAEFEKALIRERVQAGVEAARRRGRVLGRPRRAVDVQRANRLRGEGRGWRSVARVLGVPASTLRRAVAEGCAEIPLEIDAGNTAKTLNTDSPVSGVPKPNDFGTHLAANQHEEEPCDDE